jgi:hypothetical protein
LRSAALIPLDHRPFIALLRRQIGVTQNPETQMSAMQSIETELRHAVIDRLIAASLRDGTPAREANLLRWRNAGTKTGSDQLSVASDQTENPATDDF